VNFKNGCEFWAAANFQLSSSSYHGFSKNSLGSSWPWGKRCRGNVSNSEFSKNGLRSELCIELHKSGADTGDCQAFAHPMLRIRHGHWDKNCGLYGSIYWAPPWGKRVAMPPEIVNEALFGTVASLRQKRRCCRRRRFLYFPKWPGRASGSKPTFVWNCGLCGSIYWGPKQPGLRFWTDLCVELWLLWQHLLGSYLRQKSRCSARNC
jgi:hypothetical protein